MTFTAEQVRAAKEWLGEPYWGPDVTDHEDAIRAMLDAFAQRLEEDSIREADAATNVAMLKAGHKSIVAEAMREEGRREVLREIANVRPLRWNDRQEMMCIYCGLGQIAPHLPDCLWLRAKEAIK